MSSKVTGWVWDQDLVAQRKCVLLWLAERATDNGVCFPGQAEIRARTGLSESMVRRHLHWLAADQDEVGCPKRPLLRIIQRRVSCDRNTSNVYVLIVPWADAIAVQRDLQELKHMPEAGLALQGVGGTGAPQGGRHGVNPVGGTGAPQVGVAGDTEEPSLPEPDREVSPLPPSGQQQGVVDVSTTTAAGIAQVSTSATRREVAALLVEHFYAGLGSDAASVTVAIHRRDLVIGEQLVDTGATAEEAEAYAAEMAAATGRIAPVDLRSFERERVGWLARRRARTQPSSGFIDRTGLPPSWQTPSSERNSGDATAAAVVVGELPEAAVPLGEDGFRQALADALRRSRP